MFELVPVKNTWHYSAFISALAQAGDWAGALQQLAALKELHVLTRSEALRPNNVTCEWRGSGVEQQQQQARRARMYR